MMQSSNVPVRILGIIPARFGSTRLPGKPLIKIRGKTIVQRVYERVSQSEHIDEVVVATDDIRILNHIEKIGGRAVLTRADHTSGTTRCGEVVADRPEVDLVVNIQGDEPLIHPEEIDKLCAFMRDNSDRSIGTLVKRIDSTDELTDPSIAKVVMDRSGRVLYFSRSPIPYVRNHKHAHWLEHATYYKHIGLYAYDRATLIQLSAYGAGMLEQAEMLEQLNWLYHGHAVYALETDVESIGVDTEEDLNLLEHILNLADS